ncbi:class I SAM-dependent DNA methyltransferase [Acinetobacter silvestris]|uniref:SAM-dependent methyltransferase n=1 Tax=Acinetobacter silvestris TaxID=1977882 RepID=A0A1Y3CDJ2_9GAMM|nr:class I SAM-dependent methyltransferase [Acinetobacter silvestris]OTG64720.1 SAM-dependent methyltransferase [Acinetobacter silvestris]
MSDQSHGADPTFLADNIIEIYKKHAQAWTALRGHFLYEKVWLDHFLTLIPAHSQILDLGCGSGKPIAQYFIEQGHSVTGVDSSDVMIAMAKAKFPQQTWLHADMRQLHLEQKFQGILAWDSFFHLTPNDQRNMFASFAKYAEQGTVLMFTSGPSYGEVIGDMFGDALYHASLAAQEYRTLLTQYGFQVVKMVAEDVECTGHTVWLAQMQ